MRAGRLPIVLALLATLATACGPKRSELLARQSATATAVFAPVTEPAAVPTSPPPGEAVAPVVTPAPTPAPAPVLPDGPGVTATTVKVGFVIVDQTQLQKLLGVDSPESGDIDGQIRALVAAVNAEGGVAGRSIEPVIKTFDALLDSPETEEKLCREFTEDEAVFAVVLLGQLQPNARRCYAERSTLMVDQTFYPVDVDEFASLAPYLWQPSLPNYGELFRGLAQALTEEGFLTAGVRLGVVGIDSPQNRMIHERDLMPMLERAGVAPTELQWIDPTSSATLQAGQNQTILAFKQAGVDRVIVIGGSRLLAFLLTIAVPQEYFPRYAVTSFDSPDFIVREVPETMVGAVGISVQPGFDVADDQLEFPSGPGEQRCLDTLAAAGHTFVARANARQALQYCDGVFFLQEAAVAMTGSTLNADGFVPGAAALGAGWVGASNYATAFSPGGFDGTSGYRAMVFDEACSCLVLDDETRKFPE